MGIVAVVLGIVAFIIIYSVGASSTFGGLFMRVVGMLAALAGGFVGAKQAQADKEEAKSPALSYVGAGLCIIAVLFGVVNAVRGCA